MDATLAQCASLAANKTTARADTLEFDARTRRCGQLSGRMSENATHEVGRVPSNSARLPRHRQPSVAEVERISAVMHRFTHAWNALVFLLLFEDAVSFSLAASEEPAGSEDDRPFPPRESAATATHSHRCLGRFRSKDPSAVYATGIDTDHVSTCKMGQYRFSDHCTNL
jgi:hypothetical protein